jgi:hypothetical protein
VTPDEERQITLALDTSGDDAAQLVAQFSTSEQLHKWLLNYDVNCGFLPCWAALEHPKCDYATALLLYWNFHDFFFDPAWRASRPPKPREWDAVGLVDAIEARFARNDFASAELRFDPVEWLCLSEVQQRELLDLGMPAERLRTVGTRVIEREWLYADD